MKTEGIEYLKSLADEYMDEIGVKTLPWVPSPFIEDKFEEQYASPGKQVDI